MPRVSLEGSGFRSAGGIRSGWDQGGTQKQVQL